MQVPVITVNARTGKGLDQLISTVSQVLVNEHIGPDFFQIEKLAEEAINDMKLLMPGISNYSALHHLINHEQFELDEKLQESIENIEVKHKFNHTKIQAEDIQQRYQKIRVIMQKQCMKIVLKRRRCFQKTGSFFLHRTWGYLIMGIVLFILFQSVFWLADFPMTFIENTVGILGSWLGTKLPEGWISDLIINGIIAGIGGILVFVPQIMILFALITLLEDTGYMARISFLTDRIMRKVGLNGKSVMPMIGGFACAVPAILSARNIENKKND